MNNYEQVYRLLACAAAFIAFFLFLYFMSRNRKKRAGESYDERQVAARGKAYRAGFTAIMLYFAWYLVASTFEFELLHKYNVAFVWAGIVFGIAVFSVNAIMNDAFWKMNEKNTRRRVLYAVVIVINLVSGGINFFHEKDSGVFLINGLCAALFLSVLIADLIHARKAAIIEEDGE